MKELTDLRGAPKPAAMRANAGVASVVACALMFSLSACSSTRNRRSDASVNQPDDTGEATDASDHPGPVLAFSGDASGARPAPNSEATGKDEEESGGAEGGGSTSGGGARVSDNGPGGAGASVGADVDGGHGGSGGSAGASADGADSGAPGPDGGEPVDCGPWACFPMPNAMAQPPRPAAYDTSQAHVARDTITGLMWQISGSAVEYSAAELGSPCDELQLAGYSDWRLPTLVELVSLVDYTRGALAGDLMADAVFNNGGPYRFWSATQEGDTGRWLANLAGGEIDAPSFLATARVLCARTHESFDIGTPHYTVRGQGDAAVVKDGWAQLEWHATGAAANYSFTEAQVYCSSSTLDGGGWRTPSPGELYTLVQRGSEGSLKIDSAVFSGTERFTWTSTLSPLDASNAWFVDFRLGRILNFMNTGAALVDEKFAVRCVR